VESNTFSAILTFTGNMTNTAVNQNICKSDFITGTGGVSEIQMRNVSISGNKITGTGPVVGGLLFRGDVTCEYVTISDNIIKNGNFFFSSLGIPTVVSDNIIEYGIQPNNNTISGTNRCFAIIDNNEFQLGGYNSSLFGFPFEYTNIKFTNNYCGASTNVIGSGISFFFVIFF